MSTLPEKGISAAMRRKLAKRWIRQRDKLSPEEKKQLAVRKIDGPENFEQNSNAIIYIGSDVKGNLIYLRINHRKDHRVELILFFYLEDGRTYELPDHPNIVLDRVSSREWSVGDLKLSILEKSTRARVVYNGFLRMGARKDLADCRDSSLEHARFNLIFIAETEPRSRDEYWNLNLKAEALARTSWKSSEWLDLWNSIDIECVDQWGSMIGQIFLEDSTTIELFLHGMRSHEWSSDNDNNNTNQKKNVSITGFSPKGLNFQIILQDLGNGIEDIKIGHIKNACDDYLNMEKIEIGAMDAVDLSKSTVDETPIKFTVNARIYEIKIKLNRTNFRDLRGGDPWNSIYNFCGFDFELFNSTGKGIIQSWEVLEKVGPILFKDTAHRKRSIIDPCSARDLPNFLVIPFNNDICGKEELVGGKGSSLAKLTLLKSSKFIVPEGFCVTANALKKQISCNQLLFDHIVNLIKVCSDRNVEEIRPSCERLMKLFEETPVIEGVKNAILSALDELEAEESTKKFKYAIRSSAVGEDSEESSAAGQNVTFLGITDPQEIVHCVAKCWASLYSYRSVEYRRQQGLPIKSDMGVCVQKMVDAHSAGVMFTRHPLTGNPGEIFITSNYGLGESVVSALVEPDTIIVERKWSNSLKVKQVIIGKKSEKIEMSSGGGTTTRRLSKSEIEKQSVSNDLALKLANVGLTIEEEFNGPRDVEWALIDDDVYLLQCRPVTSLDNMTEFELTHELGTGVGVETDLYTFANVGEVLPHPQSPLSLSSLCKALNASFNYTLYGVIDLETYKNHFSVSYGRVCLNYINVFLRFVGKEMTVMNKFSDIIIAGHIVVTEDLFKSALERYGIVDLKTSFKFIKHLYKHSRNNDKNVEKLKDLLKSCWQKFADSKSLSTKPFYEKMNDLFMDTFHASVYHVTVSNFSSISQVVVFSLLLEGTKELTSDHMTDMANLLRSCSNVVSAGVPVAINNIAQTIKDSGFKDNFEKIESSRLDWLSEHCPKAWKQVQEFLKTYGHRAVMEFDVLTETWSLNPEKFLSTIQLTLKTNSTLKVEVEKTQPESPENVIDQLITPKKSRTKWMLKKLMPACQRNVARREMTKSLLIEMVHVLRIHYRHLEDLMIKDGLLPDKGLIFFLTHDEIGRVIEKPNNALIKKAIQRRKLHPKLMKMQFEEETTGMPRPTTKFNDVVVSADGASVTGTPVYSGVVTGRACVITDLEEASQLLSEDILITNATDIGWTPYFPMLSGVVTELGGLISHGAVVAREYGLPCIVGATSATNIFKTGDTVILDGNTGILRLVEAPNKDNL